MSRKVGDFSILIGGNASPMIPLIPGAAPAPSFGIFDVVVGFSDDPVQSAAWTDSPLPAVPDVGASVTSAPMVQDANGQVRICFAVPATPAVAGTLRLTADRDDGSGSTTVDLPIQVAAGAVAANLFVFFVAHPKPPRTYAWVKLSVVEAADGTTPITGAVVFGKLVRDNLQNGFRNLNRRAGFLTGADGTLNVDGRNVIGLPINWPFLFNAGESSHVPRGHLIRLAAANIADNLSPFVPATPIRMTKTADATLPTQKVMLDAGHGVVYALTVARRSQEWYVAHRIADRVAELLTTNHGMPAANVLMTRTAGFGLIDPTHLGSTAAPEVGDQRYAYDMEQRKISIRLGALSLKDLSNLLLTPHDDSDAPQPVPPADRQRLLDLNAAALTAITTRLDAHHGPSRRVRAGSPRWDEASSDYVYTHEKTDGSSPIDAHLPIETGDQFLVDDAMLAVLADRSARWSLAREIGSGPAASATRASFTDAARASLAINGAREYMRDKILAYLRTPPDEYLQHGNKAWGPGDRLRFMNANPCDLYISLHENAGNGKGGMTLLSGLPGADAPPDDQVRVGKIFAKYMDWFDQGLRQGGITPELDTNRVAMLHSGNANRDKYAYCELEFMDADIPGDDTQYRYQQMVNGDVVDRIAQQLVAATIELLLDRQADLDTVRYNNEFSLW